MSGLVERLRACPFCGGEAHWPEPEVNIPYVGCKDCGSCAQDEVRWNTRASDPLIEQLVEALELADATLRGANMNRNVVERKVSDALSAARGEAENG